MPSYELHSRRPSLSPFPRDFDQPLNKRNSRDHRINDFIVLIWNEVFLCSSWKYVQLIGYFGSSTLFGYLYRWHTKVTLSIQVWYEKNMEIIFQRLYNRWLSIYSKEESYLRSVLWCSRSDWWSCYAISRSLWKACQYLHRRINVPVSLLNGFQS